MPTIIYVFIAVFIVSLISLIGIFSLALEEEKLQKTISFLISFAVGVLLGDVFLHLLPGIYEEMGLEIKTSLLILFGILLFFSLEKFVKWRHCHQVDCHEHRKSIVTMNLVGDGLHNFLDGALIAGSFLTSFTLGITTTLAVIFHEIPQEMGDFGVLLHGGLKRKKALIYNFLSALLAVLGAGLVLLVGSRFQDFYLSLLPVTAGGFIYIALSDLLPELHQETQPGQSINQFLNILLGIVLMLVLVWMG